MRSEASGAIVGENDQAFVIQQWPLGPLPLQKTRYLRLLWNGWDCVWIFFTILLLFKIFATVAVSLLDGYQWGLNHRDVDWLSSLLVSFNSQLVTAFTILFNTAVATYVRRLALRKAQDGAKLGLLEQLQSSTSLASAISTAWSLRSYSKTTMLLLAIWSFYYLGSQASEREYIYRTSAGFKSITLNYQSPDSPSLFLFSSDVIKERLGYLNAFFVSAFMTSESGFGNGHDFLGFPLTPYLGYDANGNKMASRDGWYDVSSPREVSYTSFNGIALQSEFGGTGGSIWVVGAEGHFTYNASYINVTCSAPIIRAWNRTVLREYPNLTAVVNVTHHDRGTGEEASSLEIINCSFGDESASIYSCNLATVYVEVQARCSANSCTAHKIRPAPGLETPVLSTPFDNSTWAASFLGNLQLASGRPTDRATSSPFEQYITLDDANEVSKTFTQLVNSYYTVSASPYLPDLFAFGFRPTDYVPPGYPGYININMTGAQYDPGYFLSIPWLAVDFVACLIVLTALIDAISCRQSTIAPDILCYVSSLTRENLHINLPPGGSMLSGFERTRLLKDLRVQIADVGSPGAVVGQIGLRQASTDEEYYLSEEKFYV